jgi:hypothetical protein
VPTIRERASDSLLHTGVELAAERELMTRAIDAAPHNHAGYELAVSALWMAKFADSLVLWLSRRLRPNPFGR